MTATKIGYVCCSTDGHGMAIARAKEKLRGKQPKLSDKQQRELTRMHATGEYSISDLAEVFSVSHNQQSIGP